MDDIQFVLYFQPVTLKKCDQSQVAGARSLACRKQFLGFFFPHSKKSNIIGVSIHQEESLKYSIRGTQELFEKCRPRKRPHRVTLDQVLRGHTYYFLKIFDFNSKMTFMYLKFSQKNEQKKLTLPVWYLKSNCFRSFFGRIEDTKKTFQN